MIALVAVFLLSADRPSVEVRFADTAPVIDGVIEATWLEADSAYDFVQFMPYEKSPPGEKTTVYVLQDAENLYVAFRCYADSIKPIACLTADEDDIRIAIDTFGSKNTAYFFQVYASGIYNDGWVLDDGRTFDGSWEGVWYRALKIYDDRWEVEVKIPFKSIRYKKGLGQWGLALARRMARNREISTWGEFTQKEDVQVSKYGYLRGIDPQAKGYYFELYPEAYVRIDRNYYYDNALSLSTDTTDVKPSMSLNLKWDVTPQTTVNATVLPDFAQIESDPFSLNLSQYPTYLDERRPFFLEGKDIFRMSDFGDMNFFEPLEIFYSRRIGKSINGDAIPILGGLKITNKSQDWNLGMLGAYTGSYLDTTTYYIDEPERWFGAVRARRSVFDNSDIGVLFSGTAVDAETRNCALGIDGVYRSGPNQFIVQAAASSMKDSLQDKYGLAFDAGYFGFVKNFITIAMARVIQDSFDVSHIGFVPWTGTKRFMLGTGPYVECPRGPVRRFFVAPGITVLQEPFTTDWSYLGMTEVNFSFRNDWGLDFSVNAGPYNEAPYPGLDTNYFRRELHLSVWGNFLANHFEAGCSYEYGWNYLRGLLAYQGTNRVSYNYSIIPQVSAGLGIWHWIEWDDQNEIIYTWPMFRPNVNVRFNSDITLNIFDEIVTQTPGTDFGALEMLQNRIGALFSWNFRPKSWIYIAVNDFRDQDVSGNLQPRYQIAAIKAKYLIYF